MNWRLIQIAATLALLGAAWLHGYRTGAAAIEAHYTAAALAQAKSAADAQRRILAAEQDARLLSQALEDSARAEPVQSPACLPRSRVLRLKSYETPP